MSDTTECKLSAENDGTPGERDATVKTGWRPLCEAPINEQVLVFVQDGRIQRYLQMMQNEDGTWYDMNLQGYVRTRFDGAWMPLPLPPESSHE